jgi:hypothetical protein
VKLHPTLALLAIVCVAGCRETPRAYYATAADAVADGAIARGWLPDVLASNVRDIHESHDVDSIHGNAVFRYEADLIPKLQRECAPKPPSDGHLLAYQCAGSFTISLDPAQRRGYLSH